MAVNIQLLILQASAVLAAGVVHTDGSQEWSPPWCQLPQSLARTKPETRPWASGGVERMERRCEDASVVH